ncbi:hypothetical protein Cni_G00160 [Canna indica]|uniref:RING-type domain-containing protein n=1 Tax=Canna indica TaxID=4628 RepID=A0AAQ3JMA9_9LILI|nr:hypothetical protein Cni_G00160 [Canna indica]
MYLQESNTFESIEAVDEDEDDREDITFENERCGICTDIIIDRGVLDCCDDWFCFACIDNWATITNCCPICKNEFQLITCFPVYDTTGSISFENYLLSRDEDWSVQGKNNALSFPSYYIDEDAVACLDGNGCKVRSGLATDDELTFDTSIACDSCDIWYHAFCVGFHPECTSVSSWLCPRCLSIEEPEKMDQVSVEDQGKNSDSKGAELGCAVDHSFLGKVSVSVADDGETALVVSMVQADQTSKDKISASVENWVETSMNKEIQSTSADSNIINSNPKLNDVVDKIDGYKLKGLSQDGQVSPCHPLIHSSMEANCAEETLCSSRFNEQDDSFSISCDSYQNMAELPQDKFGELVDVAAKDPLVISRTLHNSEECNISVDGIITSSVEDVVNAICQEDFKVADPMREHAVESNLGIVDVDSMSNDKHKRKKESQVKSKDADNAKKPKLDRISLMMPSESQVNDFVPDHSKAYPKATRGCKHDNMKYVAENEAQPSDIMNIVREDHKLHDDQTGKKLVNKTIEKRDDSAGLRVKKIMRRVGDKTDKEIMVQKLRKEIKEAVQDKTSNCDVKDSAFHGKLLTAFREAIIEPREIGNKPNPSLGVRNQLLKKGKTRENLTKKIYGTTNGRRRRAWDRDWEIEFWKHRCPKIKPEKVETLQSVLELLKKATTPCSENPEIEGPEGDGTNSILSRVYLADASVFPRKDDIKPLSAIPKISEKDSQKVVSSVANDLKLQIKVQPSDNQVKNISVPTIPKKAPSKSGNADVENSGTSPMPAASTLKGKGQKLKEASVSAKSEQISKEPDNSAAMAKSDKRKWAMEVLARKNALTSSSAAKEAQEDGATLKGNYPLLAQLPIDMRPVVAPSRQNKIPISIRQAQLYRIAEHYLRRTNLSVICRTADVELAVADAVNIEKDISERSSSKMVYANLCAQVVAQCTKVQSDAVQSDLLVSDADLEVENTGSCIYQDAKETNTESTPLIFTDVEEALRAAGLSDSPPSSPSRTVKDSEAEVDPLLNNGSKDIDNVHEMDTLPQVDACSGSENKLGDEGYSASSGAANSSKVSESENGIAIVKGMYSGSVSKESSKCLNYDSSEPRNSSEPLADNTQDNFGKGNEQVNVKANSTATRLFQQDELNELPSSKDKELYRQEKESLSTKVVSEASKVIEKKAVGQTDINDENKSRPKENCSENNIISDKVPSKVNSSKGENSSNSLIGETAPKLEQAKLSTSESSNSVYKKVEAYVKEHIRPLCKSGVITVEQYKWAVGRTTDKVMARHCESKNANFLIKEGEKVKKLAEQYVEVAQQKMP